MAPFLNFQINPLAFSSSFQVFLQNSLTTSRCCHHCGIYVYLIYFFWLAEQYDGNEGRDQLLLVVSWHSFVL